MAVRVRKLARQIGRSPAEVLGLLHALGFPRYRSSEDMVADPVAEKAREAARDGMKAEPIAPEAVPKPSAPAAPVERDMMAALVPGVVRQGEAAPPVARSRPAPHPKPTSKAAPAASGAMVAKELFVAAEAERDRLAHRVVELERAARQVGAELEAIRAELAEARAELTDARAAIPPVGEPLPGLLEGRGLLGRDEQRQALLALLGARAIDAAQLSAADPGGLRAALADRLILFGGDVPAELTGAAGVSVSTDRADLPGSSGIARLIDRAGEQLLLRGIRRVRAIGVPPRWHALLRGRMDSRVDLSIEPGGPRDAARARQDAQGTDALWLWATGGDDAARAVWAEGVQLVVDGPATLDGALEALLEALVER